MILLTRNFICVLFRFDNSHDLKTKKKHTFNNMRDLLGIYSNTENSSSFSGNRVIPIGSKHLHCTPPADYKLSG